MDAEERFHQMLVVFSSNAKVQMTPFHFEMYDEAMVAAGISYLEACVAMKSLMKKVKVWSMPTPAQIIDEARPRVAAIHEANNVAGMIIQAVRDHGYSNERLARLQVGELAWTVVNRFGGWNHVCTGDHDQGQLRAQLRDCAMAIVETAKVRDIEEQPQLDGPAAQSVRLLGQVKGMP